MYYKKGNTVYVEVLGENFVLSNQNDKVPILEGLLMCHGHKHKAPWIPEYVPDNVRWTYFDADERSDPDILANYRTYEPKIKYDIIVEQGCPIYDRKNLIMFGTEMKNYLKKGGKLIIKNLLQDYMKSDIYLNKEDIDYSYSKIYNSKIHLVIKRYIVFTY